MDVNVGVLMFSAVVNIAWAVAMVLVMKEFATKLIAGLANRSSGLAAAMAEFKAGMTVNPDGSEVNGNGQSNYNQHRRVPTFQQPAADSH
jgi:hypothetical protein